MNEPATIAAWAAAIAAVIGPVISVAMAHLMVTQENLKRDASLLFQKLTEHMTSLRVTIRATHDAVSSYKDYNDKVFKKQEYST